MFSFVDLFHTDSEMYSIDGKLQYSQLLNFPVLHNVGQIEYSKHVGIGIEFIQGDDIWYKESFPGVYLDIWYVMAPAT